MLIIVPTRNRPKNIKIFYDAWKKNTSGCSTVVLMTDKDDKNDYSYTGFIIDQNKQGTTVEKLNWGAERYSKGFEVIGFIGDDTVIETKNFDKRICKHLKKYKYGLLKPNSVYHNTHIPDHWFITKRLYDFMGWMANPEMVHTRVDYCWADVAKEIDTLVDGAYIYDPSIVIRHNHFLYNKEVGYDKVYQKAYRKQYVNADNLAWKSKWPIEFKKIKEKLHMVDLLMITHNRHAYAVKALEGILNQTYKNFNLIIWDNGSKRTMYPWLNSIDDDRVTVIKNPGNDPLASVTSHVFLESKKKYVGKIDSDTLLPPDWLERCIDAQEKHHFGFIGGFHFRPEDMKDIEPNLTTINGVSYWRKSHIGGCAFLICRDDFEEYSGEGLFGLTEYQHDFDRRLLYNGYLWSPPLYVELMDDPRSKYFISTDEYARYKRKTRNCAVDEPLTERNNARNYLRLNSNVDTNK